MWKCGWTWGSRYDELGIPCIIDSYRKRIGVNSLLVIDVGCSKGDAMNDCQRLLKTRGVQLDTVGIDQSPNVKKKAEKNLDRFILSDVLRVENNDNTADVVICANMLRYRVMPEEKRLIVKKCASFLKPPGILILASPFPDQFGRRPEKDESDLCEPTIRRKVMRSLLANFGNNLLKEVKILDKSVAERFSKHAM